MDKQFAGHSYRGKTLDMAAAIEEPWPGSTDGTTIEGMPVVKRSVSLSPSVVERAERAAAAEGLSLSAWIDRTLDHHLGIREGLEAVAEYEAEHGTFTPEELAEGRRILNESLARSAELHRKRNER